MKMLKILLLMFSTSLTAGETELPSAYIFKIGMSEYTGYAFIQLHVNLARLENSGNYWENYPPELYGYIEVSNTSNSPVCLQKSNTLLFDITTSVGKNMYLTALSSLSLESGNSSDIQIERLKYFYDNSDCIEDLPHTKLTRLVQKL